MKKSDRQVKACKSGEKGGKWAFEMIEMMVRGYCGLWTSAAIMSTTIFARCKRPIKWLCVQQSQQWPLHASQEKKITCKRPALTNRGFLFTTKLSLQSNADIL